MMQGLGIDIIEIARVTKLFECHQLQFAQKILSTQELKDIDTVVDKGRFIAKKLAAKEAFAKAMGTGLRAPIHLTALSVYHDKLGRPVLNYNEAVAALLQDNAIKQVLLSISDSEHYAVAVVMIS